VGTGSDEHHRHDHGNQRQSDHPLCRRRKAPVPHSRFPPDIVSTQA